MKQHAQRALRLRALPNTAPLIRQPRNLSQVLGSLLIMLFVMTLTSCATSELASKPAPEKNVASKPAVPPAARPTLAQGHTLNSVALGGDMAYHVYLPAAYREQASQRFPVVYWLHGSNGSSQGAGTMIARFFEAAMRTGKIPPMIVVFPDGFKQGMWVNSSDGTLQLETILIEELIPLIDANYRTIASRQGRVLEGGSMGGYGAARLAFKYPDLFAGASMLSAGPLQPVLDPDEAPIVGRANAQAVLDRTYGGSKAQFRAQSPWVLAEQIPPEAKGAVRLRFMVGENDPVMTYNLQLSEHLHKLGIPHEFEPLPNVDHSPRQLFGALIKHPHYWAFFREMFDSDT